MWEETKKMWEETKKFLRDFPSPTGSPSPSPASPEYGMAEGIESPKILTIGKMYECQHCNDIFYVRFTKGMERAVDEYLKCEKCGSVNVEETDKHG
jgi:DNA-directed RNA polymerase subunit RPC12/RpoP